MSINLSISSVRHLFHMCQNAGVLCILACKCASRHSGVPCFPIGTSKIAPRMWCFAHFDLQMCFAPQRRAIFADRNFKNCSENVVFCAFWLACHFCRSELQKLLRECCVLRILTWKCASRHSGVPFFMSLSNSYLRTRRFSELTFRTSGTTKHWKNTAIRDFLNICRMCIFFLVTLLACWSSFFWLDFSTRLFSCPCCRKLGF